VSNGSMLYFSEPDKARTKRGRMESLPTPKSSGRGLFLLVLLLGVSALLGGLYGPSVKATAAGGSDDLQDSVKSFTRVLSVVERNYADPVDVDKSIYDGAIPGMLHVLDPHSNFFDPQQYALFREEQEGKYYGVGMTVAPRENQTVVLAPFMASPAAKAGIRPGDTILQVDGKNCTGLTTTQVADMLKGAKGTTVHLSLGREGWDKPIEVTVVRDEIPRPGVEFSEMVKPGIGYVRVSTFNETTDSDLAEALKQLNYSKLDGLIIDLRNNGGGLLNQAVGMADMFLDKNEIVVSHRGRSSPERRYYAVRGNQGIEVPLIVLVNGQSASASEIVSGAIQDHDRGLIVGEVSFGKGLVQTQFPLSEDTALLLTTARYYTPSGRLIQRDYKNVTLYDYHYNPKPPQKPEVKLTDGGRQVFGGGGITPDQVIAMPKPNEFEEMLLRRGVFYPFPSGVGDFARYYLGSRPAITKEFSPDDSVIAQLRKFLDQQHIKYTDQEIQANDSWLKWEIKREVFTTIFGLNEGYKVALQNDAQLDKGIEMIPQAKALYANVRKVVAQRQTDGARP
jgi:carboxyl-terminal processing protease